MKGYHYLMRLAHLFNTLTRFSKELAGLLLDLGVHAEVGFIRNTLTGRWLDKQDIGQRLAQPFRFNHKTLVKVLRSNYARGRHQRGTDASGKVSARLGR